MALLQSGQPRTGTLAGGSFVDYAIEIQKGSYIELVAEQRGADVELTLHSPEGHELLRVDSPNGRSGKEMLTYVAHSKGTYRLRVSALGEPGISGRFTIVIKTLRYASEVDRLRSASRKQLLATRQRVAIGNRDARIAAVEELKSLIPVWRSIGDDADLVATLIDLALVKRDLGRTHQAIASLREALLVSERSGLKAQKVEILNHLGLLLLTIGEVQEAQQRFLAAQRGAEANGDLFGKASALNNLGLIEQSRGHLHEAITSFRAALTTWRKLGNLREEAIVLSNLGDLYSILYRFEEARIYLHRSILLSRRLGNTKGEALSLNSLGLVHARWGNMKSALSCYQQALRMLHKIEDRRFEIYVLNNLGWLHFQQEEFDEATHMYYEAFRLARTIGDRTIEPVVLNNLGWLLAAQGHPRRALSRHRKAQELFAQNQSTLGQAAALFGIASAERSLNNSALAQSTIQEAILLVETVRTSLTDLELRVSFFSTRHDLYEFGIDLLVESFEVTGEKHLIVQAFELSERARARGFLDTLNERSLRQARGSFTKPWSLGTAQHMLEPHAKLLHIELADRRSFLWLVGKSSIAFRILPSEHDITSAALECHSLLSKSDMRRLQVSAYRACRNLAGLLGLSILRELHGERLYISAEGALQLVPFGALPMTFLQPEHGQREEFLLSRFDLSLIPSISILGQLRQRASRQMASRRKVLVIADPLYEHNDLRVKAPASSCAEISADTFAAVETTKRLHYSKEEAKRIAGLVPHGQARTVMGASANRSLLKNGALKEAEILHFAVHGIFQADAPENSGLLLSQFDEQGCPNEGMVRASEIAILDLEPVRLAVLSACETALGARIEGEGTVGLPRAFLQAGADQVVVSLWKIRDYAATELMTRFYERHIIQGLPPSEALRQAQLSMAREPRWRSPAYWAGFVVHG